MLDFNKHLSKSNSLYFFLLLRMFNIFSGFIVFLQCHITKNFSLSYCHILNMCWYIFINTQPSVYLKKNCTFMSRTCSFGLTSLSQILVVLKTVLPSTLTLCDVHLCIMVPIWSEQTAQSAAESSSKWEPEVRSINDTRKVKPLMTFQLPFYSSFSLDLTYIVVYTCNLE